MTVLMYAVYRAACELMTEDERRRAEDLANDADRGSTAAEMLLRRMTFEIVTDRGRITGH